MIVPLKKKGVTVTFDNVVMDVDVPTSARGASHHKRNSRLRFPNLWDNDNDDLSAREDAYARKSWGAVSESKTTADDSDLAYGNPARKLDFSPYT